MWSLHTKYLGKVSYILAPKFPEHFKNLKRVFDEMEHDLLTEAFISTKAFLASHFPKLNRSNTLVTVVFVVFIVQDM